MILDLMNEKKVYRNILDFGAGRAEIFRETLEKRALQVKCIDKEEIIDLRWKFDVVVCASVLEFTNLPVTLKLIKSVIAPNGMIVASSPMNTWASRLYFKLIKDKNSRNTHQDILKEAAKHFFIIEQKEWFGLYFAFKGYPK